MMKNNLEFIAKLLMLSGLVSLLIKYAGPNLSIAATNANALIIVLLPNVMLSMALFWRFQSAQPQNK